MRIVNPGVEILTPIDGADILRRIEAAGRVCYKSEGAIKDGSAEKFVANVIKRGHESVLEHVSLTVKFIIDRGVSHEIVRHRIASYSQESTRYCNYGDDKFGSEVTFIKPLFFDVGTRAYEIWKRSCEDSEKSYFDLLDEGCSPQQARSVLTNSLKTELVATMNLREWRHFFRLRTAMDAHPQMREVAIQLFAVMKSGIPAVFSDIEIPEFGDAHE